MISIYELRFRYLFGRAENAEDQDMGDLLFFDSGRSALYFLLRELRHQMAEPTVYVNAYTTDVVHATIRFLGLPIVPVDLDPRDFSTVERDYRFNENSIFIQTGLFGFPSFNMRIRNSVRAAGGVFIEDCCNSWGTRIAGKSAGDLGDAAFFSFRIGKAFSSSGGAAKLQPERWASELINRYDAIRMPGRWESLVQLTRSGLDYLMFEPWILAHVGRPIRSFQSKHAWMNGLIKGGVVDTEYKVNDESISKLGLAQKKLLVRRASRFEEERQRKKRVSRNLAEGLKGLPLSTPADDPDLVGDWNGLFFPVLLQRGDPDAMIQHLRANGFDGSRFHYYVPDKSFPGLDRDLFQGSFHLVDRLVCIPNTTRMEGLEERLCRVVRDYLDQAKM